MTVSIELKSYNNIQIEGEINKMMETTFEEKIKKLEEIATELESGKLNLDESMKKFEEGIMLSKECNKILDEAEKKITILINDNGELKEENYITNEE